MELTIDDIQVLFTSVPGIAFLVGSIMKFVRVQQDDGTETLPLGISTKWIPFAGLLVGSVFAALGYFTQEVELENQVYAALAGTGLAVGFVSAVRSTKKAMQGPETTEELPEVGDML